jgi:hypothetical protein
MSSVPVALVPDELSPNPTTLPPLPVVVFAQASTVTAAG